MNNKDFMKKVVAVLEKQQSALKKLAFGGGVKTQGEDVVSEVSSILQQATTAVKANPKNHSVQSASFYPEEGMLKVKLHQPMSLMGTPESKSVTNKVKELLEADPANKTVEIIGVFG